VFGNALVSGDAWEKSPLQIQGTRHFFNMSGKLEIQVGCKSAKISWWKDHYKEVGKSEGYSEDQITEYGLYIELAEKLYGCD
jgi:hypothetical protein